MTVIFLLFFILSCTTTTVLSVEDKHDEIVLLKIKKQLGNPDSLRWLVKGFDFCNSTGLESAYITCTNTGRVQMLVLERLAMIASPFPDAICSLTELDYLVLYSIPQLYGPIPSCITKLPKLANLYIMYTSLSGPVPKYFSNHNNIRTIILSHNYLSGAIPSSLSTLPNLYYLDLSFNSLTGPIPPELVHGQYPGLVLSNNNLTGDLPKCYGWVNFGLLDVGNNQLTGDAAFLFGKQKMTGTIVLANNSFEFDLSYVEFSDNLYSLDISHNKIYGRVPASFATAANLWYADLSYNRLCGELPQGYNMCRFNPTVFENNTCLFGIPQSPCPYDWAPAPAPVWDMSTAPYATWAPELAPISESPF